jgi:hypothetical protein
MNHARERGATDRRRRRRVLVPLRERLERKLDRSGGPNACWPWQGATDHKGYGVIGLGRRADGTDRTHQVAWMLAHGPIPRGLCVLHKCDNPPCCNDAHLFLGTIADNNRDMVAKGRHAWTKNPHLRARGERHGRAKLTDDAVREIRARYAAGGVTQRELAAAHGVDQQVIWAIIHRRRWAHVSDSAPITGAEES